MLPYSKIEAKNKNNNRPNALLVTNLRSNEPFRPKAMTDYEKKKEEEKKKMHNELLRTSMYERDV
jgi:hypothetical protein